VSGRQPWPDRSAPGREVVELRHPPVRRSLVATLLPVVWLALVLPTAGWVAGELTGKLHEAPRRDDGRSLVLIPLGTFDRRWWQRGPVRDLLRRMRPDLRIGADGTRPLV